MSGGSRTTTRAAGPSTGLDVAGMALLLTVGAWGFGRVFPAGDVAVATGTGIVAGLALAFLAARLRLGLLATSGVLLALYFVLGGVAVFRLESIGGIVPTPDVLQKLLFGAVTSWKSLLTTEVPVTGFPALAIVPYISTLVAALLAGTIAVRARGRLWPLALLPAAGLVVVSVAFGTTEPVEPLVQGALFAVVALGWAAWRATAGPQSRAGVVQVEGLMVDPRSSSRLARRRVSVGLALVLAATVLGGAAASALQTDTTRETLRTSILPPLDLRNYASPLTSFRKYVRDDKTTVLFTVGGLAKDQRVRLATMDSYDGLVFNVTGAGGAGSGRFARVGSAIPLPVPDAVTDARGGTTSVLTVSVEAYSGVWLPDSGSLTSIVFSGDRASTLQDSLNYNDATGVALDTAGLTDGDAYTFDTVLPVKPTDGQLADVPVAATGLPDAVAVPDAVSSVATAAVEDKTTPISQLRALETELSTTGFFSHGLEGETDSRPGHGSERLQSMLGGTQIIGDDEQYAAAMALMAGQLGLPARVVMGFYPPATADLTQPVAITGDDVHAWVEVAFEGYGWVSFDPTPAKDRVPQDQAPEPKTNPRAQVLQPPDPPVAPPDLPADTPQEDTAPPSADPGPGWLSAAVVIGGISLGVILLLLAPPVVIGMLKARRRRRRFGAARAADRISGGWTEVLDRAADLGAPLLVGATRREHASALHESFPSADLPGFAERADQAVFGPEDPTPREVTAFWQQADDLVGELSGSVGWYGRVRARLSVRSLRRARRARKDSDSG